MSYEVRRIENQLTGQKGYGVFISGARVFLDPLIVVRTERAANKWVTRLVKQRAYRQAWRST